MYIKGFDENLQCRGYQFKVGEEYQIDHDGPMELCTDTVFHFCESMQDVHAHYSVDEANRFCIIEPLGPVITDGMKCGSDHIRIVRELTVDEVKHVTGQINGNTGLWNSGDWNSGNWNSGYRNSGDRNSGNWNSGYRNSGDWNSGYWNSGDWNSGDRNSGNWNSGNWNSGDWNSGIANKCNDSNGVFCNEADMDIRIFNKPSGMSLHDFYNSKYFDAMISAPYELTIWVNYTDEEKASDPEKALAGGHLVKRTPEEAWADWWTALSDENREIIKQIPNFDADIFRDITGIEI